MEQYFGIDLGTTNSCISVYTSKGRSQVITLDDKGSTTMPSCVMFKSGQPVIGKEAYLKRFEKFSQSGNKSTGVACYSIKRRMGDLTAKHTFLDEQTGNEIKTLNPVEVSSLILQGIVEKASRQYPNIKDSKIVITVPASFNSEQRKQTKEAGEMIGLQVVDIINEPTSASLCYENSVSEYVLVYDLGGGTFDCSLLQIDVPPSGEFNIPDLGINLILTKEEKKEKTSFKILASEGSPKLGGDDLDDLMFNLLLKSICEKYNLTLDYLTNNISDETKAELIFLIEQFKKNNDIYSNKVEVKTLDNKIFETFLTQKIYTKASEAIYDRTLGYVNSCINAITDLNKHISKIVLVGGSTKNENIRNFLQRDFPNCIIDCAINPDEAVGAGASIQTAIHENVFNKHFVDIVPYTLGIEVAEMTISNTEQIVINHLVKKGTPIPFKGKKCFNIDTAEDNGITSADFTVKLYQGDALIPELNTFLGDVVLSADINSKNVYLIYEIDSTGILNLSCVDDKGNTVSVKFGSIKTLATNAENKLAEIKSPLVKKQIKFLKKNNIEINEYLLNLILEADKTSNLNKLIEYLRGLN